MTDVVYLVKPEDENEELRYSLRSLEKNLPHGRVFFAGYKPSWVQNVEHIATEQIEGEKHQNSLRNQWAAFTSDEVSDTFYLFNDDHFVMKRMNEVPILNWGDLEHALVNCKNLGWSFRNSMLRTRTLLLDRKLSTVSYQLHIPLVTPKQQLRDTFLEFPSPDADGTWLHHFTLAGNIYNWGGVSQDHDVKVHSWYEIPWWAERSPFLSTSDESFAYGEIGKHIRSQFPEPSRYER